MLFTSVKQIAKLPDQIIREKREELVKVKPNKKRKKPHETKKKQDPTEKKEEEDSYSSEDFQDA